MDLFGSLLSIVQTLVVLYGGVFFLRKIRQIRKQPPGPWGWPLIGSLVKLNKENSLLKIQQYKKEYGNIFQISVGNFNVAVISGQGLIQESLKREELSGRPDFEAWTSRNGGIKNRGILFTDSNATWSEQRRFALRSLRDFGFGKQSLEGLLLHELDELIQKFRTCTGKPINLKNTFNCSVFNSLWYILTGKRFELNDPKFHSLMTTFSGHMDKLSLFSPANFYPWPAKYNLVRPGLWENARRMSMNFRQLMADLIEEHQGSQEEGVTRDFIDAYLLHHKAAASDSSFHSDEGIKNLVVALQDLFQAGTETTSTTLLWGILFLTKDPEVQKKIHAELDQVIGHDRQPNRDDKLRMPYMLAFINEVHRKGTVLPMSVFHKVVQDCNFGGYELKSGTVVYPNIYDLHHSTEVWGDPASFRPERFLDPTGTQLVHKEALMPFSMGKRVCLGETLARDTLFLFLCGLLQNFTFQLDTSTELKEGRSIPKPNFIRSPYDFQVILTNRRKSSQK